LIIEKRATSSSGLWAVWAGTPFTSTVGVISGMSPLWIDVLTTGAVIAQDVRGLTATTPYHWRARVMYEPGNPVSAALRGTNGRLGQRAGRWVHVPWNAWTETDFRTSSRARKAPAPTIG